MILIIIKMIVRVVRAFYYLCWVKKHLMRKYSPNTRGIILNKEVLRRRELKRILTTCVVIYNL